MIQAWCFKLAVFSTDVFNENSSPFEDGKISDAALLEGQYVYDPQDTVFLMPNFFAIDKLSISVHLLGAKQLASFTIPDSFQLEDGATEISVLVPSQMTDGTNFYRTIAGKEFAGFFVCISQANLSTYSYDEMHFNVIYKVSSLLSSVELGFQLPQD